MDQISCLQNINSWKWDDFSQGFSARCLPQPRGSSTRGQGGPGVAARSWQVGFFLFFPEMISYNQLGSEFWFDRMFSQVPRSFWHDRGDAVLARPAPERAETDSRPRLGQRLTIKGHDLTFCGFVKHFPSGWGVFLFLARRSFSISPSSRIKPSWLFVVAFLLQIWTLCRRFHSAPWNQNELSIDEMNPLYTFAHYTFVFFRALIKGRISKNTIQNIE